MQIIDSYFDPIKYLNQAHTTRYWHVPNPFHADMYECVCVCACMHVYV